VSGTGRFGGPAEAQVLNITRFSKVGSVIEFEVYQGSSVVLRREYYGRCRLDGTLSLDEAREEQVRLLGEGYRVAAAG
jgi:hypothetical protein